GAGDVNADAADGADIDQQGHQHEDDLEERRAADEGNAAAGALDGGTVEINQAGSGHRHGNVEGEITGFGTIGFPAHAEPQAVGDHDAADHEKQQRHHDFHAALADNAAVLTLVGVVHGSCRSS